MPLESCDNETLPVRKALTAGLFMNAVKLVDTAYDPRQPSGAGVNTYHIVRSTGPGQWLISFASLTAFDEGMAYAHLAACDVPHFACWLTDTCSAARQCSFAGWLKDGVLQQTAVAHGRSEAATGHGRDVRRFLHVASQGRRRGCACTRRRCSRARGRSGCCSGRCSRAPAAGMR